jgi:hypothetical protein
MELGGLGSRVSCFWHIGEMASRLSCLDPGYSPAQGALPHRAGQNPHQSAEKMAGTMYNRSKEIGGGTGALSQSHEITLKHVENRKLIRPSSFYLFPMLTCMKFRPCHEQVGFAFEGKDIRLEVWYWFAAW